MSALLQHVLAWLLLSAALAAPAAETDPPGRVGRISLAEEGTLLRHGDGLVGGVAALNWPLTDGAWIETSGRSRSEARIGSTALRLDAGTVLELVELSDERIWLRLQRGSLLLTVSNPEHAAELTLDTPEGRLRLGQSGRYRADAIGGTTAFTAYRGLARIEAYELSVRGGERVLLLGGTERRYVLGRALTDEFASWDTAREEAHAPSRHVSPEMTGQETLDRHGQWQETAEYGPAWFPASVAAGWAPYRSGRWAWLPPWGWTWIDSAPWGFAPFHYGRWALVGGRWAWIPGTYVPRPVYAPALVAWVGQPGWQVGMAFGAAPAAGWYPLAPREAYHPHYRSSPRHLHMVNSGQPVQSNTPPSSGPDHRFGHRHRHLAVTQTPVKTQAPTAPEARLAAPANAILSPQKGLIHAEAPPQPVPPKRHERPAATEPQTTAGQMTARPARLEPGRMTGAMASHPHGSEAAHGMPKEVRRSREAGPRESNPKQFHSDR